MQDLKLVNDKIQSGERSDYYKGYLDGVTDAEKAAELLILNRRLEAAKIEGMTAGILKSLNNYVDSMEEIEREFDNEIHYIQSIKR